MKKLLSITITIVILCLCKTCFSQYANLEFVENKGQWDQRVKFKGVLNNGAFFLQEKGFKVLQNRPEDLRKLDDYFHGISRSSSPNNTSPNTLSKSVTPISADDEIIVHSHSYEVTFVNAGNPVIVADKPLTSYNNYFIGNDSSKWKGNCRIYQGVTYQNVYPDIDIRYYTNDGLLKYNVVVNPGADISQVLMKYDGVDGLQVKNEQLVIKTSAGEVRELAPYAYQIIKGLKKEVGCRFKVTGKTVQFIVDKYAKTSALVIDPALIFSTLNGSRADNWGYTATYGPDGSFYGGGIVFEPGFPTNTGAFSQTFHGGKNEGEGRGFDIGIMKFTPDGSNRTYATYIGGSGNEQPHSLVVDAQGELVIAGRSNSDDYPVTNTALAGEDYDIILTKLNAAGSALIGSRKIGGKGVDGVNIRGKYTLPKGAESIRRNYGDDARSEVILDNAGNILLASNTQSADFPVFNPFQALKDSLQDAVILKISPDLGTILFSSFLGGSKDDAAFVLAINPLNNNIYVGGNTVSTNLPGDKTGVINPRFQLGETDGFVSIISGSTNALLKTTYIGTPGNDMLYGIQFDKFGFPYIMGTTTGTWPVLNAPFFQKDGKQFIAKLQPDLSGYVYSTVFGTGAFAPNISPVAFLVDRCENVYMSGWGGGDVSAGYPHAGTAGLTVTPDAIQSTTDNADFYFFVLERNAVKQLYGSYFGQKGGFGEHVDGGTSRFDRNGVIYQAICANCGNDVTFPTTPGVWASSNGSGKGCNLAAIKIAFNLAGVAGSVRSSIQGVVNDTSGCVPLTVNFADTLAEGKSYVWNFGDGSGDVVTTNPNLSHTFNNIGNYHVRLTSIDSSKCNIADTAYTTIRVRTDKVSLGFIPKKLLPCTASNYQFTNTSFVTPSGKSFTDTSFTWVFGDNSAPVIAGNNVITHNFPGPGIYKVRLTLTDTNFCNSPDFLEVSLRIATNVKAAFETPNAGCAPYTAVFDNISSGGQQFDWDFGDGVVSQAISPTHDYPTPGTYVIKLTAIDSGTCNIIDSTNFTLVVSSKPTASFTFTPNPPLANTPVDFFNNSIGATRNLWQFGDGDTSMTTTNVSVQHLYNATKTFNACLVAFNNYGCVDTACQDIAAKIIPLLDVPNALTPNGDGINDKVFVRGFGIIKMLWRIYNRWGALVFQTSDKTQGWDGTYKGSIQPTEVYHYVLDVEYSDNTKYSKKGDITLLR